MFSPTLSRFFPEYYNYNCYDNYVTARDFITARDDIRSYEIEFAFEQPVCHNPDVTNLQND